MAYNERVDIDKAMSAMKFMAEYVTSPENRAELDIAEAAAKEPLHGLILTGIIEGIFPGDAKSNTRVRDKLISAFDFGYYYGKYSSKKDRE